MRKFQEFTGDIPVVQITKRLIDLYLGERAKEIMKSSVNVELRHLKAALTKAVDWNYLSFRAFARLTFTRRPFF